MQPCAISVIKGDITTLDVDAIINSANRSLLGGGGVDRGDRRAAGRFELLAKCIELCGCPVGEAGSRRATRSRPSRDPHRRPRLLAAHRTRSRRFAAPSRPHSTLRET